MVLPLPKITSENLQREQQKQQKRTVLLTSLIYKVNHETKKKKKKITIKKAVKAQKNWNILCL